MTITPAIIPIIIYQDAIFNGMYTFSDGDGNLLDLTGYTGSMMIRVNIDAIDPIATLTTENGGITLGGSLGTMLLYISSTDTSALPAPSAIYDLLLIDGSGVPSRFMQGNVTISRAVTR